MRIGIDAYLLHEGGDFRAAGVSVYTRQLLTALPAVAPENEYRAFVRPGAPLIPGVAPVRPPVSLDGPAQRIAWEHLGLPLQAHRNRVQLLHGVVNLIPDLWRGPSVATVHDLSFLRYPDRLTRRRSLYLRYAVGHSARRATRVIAVSRNTSRDLVELAGVPAEKISVVYPGVDAAFRPLPDVRGARERHPLAGRPFILNVGTLEPRKNQDVLIRAYASLRRRLGIPHALALVGARGWMYESIFELVEKLGLVEHVEFVDYVSPSDLPLWYNCADLFAYPSEYEGFGLPVLEAMASGLPVVTSSSSSLGELAGDACLTVEPGSEEALEAAMSRIIEDAGLRTTLSDAGLRRSSEFTWMNTARGTLDVYRAVLGEE